MDGLTDRIVTAKRKRHIADAAAYERIRRCCLDLARRLDECDAVFSVLFDARGHGENIRVEYDVGRVEAKSLRQYVVGSFADIDLTLDRIGLAVLIERHDDDRSAIGQCQFCMLYELLFAFFEADRINNGFTLHATQSRLDNGPLRGIDHDGQAGNVWLRHDEFQEPFHGLL